MKKSNEAVCPLSHEQASRLVQLFAPSFDACLAQAADKAGRPVVWQPVLTDIHEQVVHALSPVLIENRQQPGEVSPTLSLTLLPPPTRDTRLQPVPGQPLAPDSLTPTVKTSL
ncbi:hypothetical protein F5984_24275 [Rudanella paleaurantiibacter]|uniref:Uncharacterized protein n=1 Tax=Rudanella paleaurantiibacter TaxID=2614655 RepID=A0A7J5TSH8_9BACT|nr:MULTISPECIES: hypothetical protein [Rudanella]KAB7726441.1 hypothetical protein F5984_24275 [Rudanella paleaurantiibacter]